MIKMKRSLSLPPCLIFWEILIGFLHLTTGQCLDQDSSKSKYGDVQTFSDAITDFSMDLFKELYRTTTNGSRENLFISPLSVHSALTMAYLGASGNTKVQLQQELRMGDFGQQRALELYHQLTKNHLLHNASKTSNYTFNFASKLYVDASVSLRECIRHHLGEHVEEVDFVRQPYLVRHMINDWVERLTNSKIRDLLPDGSVDSANRIVAVSATYFRGYWLNQFKEEATHQQDFHVERHERVRVDMMWEEDRFLYTKDVLTNCSVIELPYSGNRTAMVILLPDPGSDLTAVIQAIDRKSLAKLYAKMLSTPVDLMIPKFKLEQTLELTSTMRALGVTDIFDPIRANLTGLHTDSQRLTIPFLHQKTFLDVNEGGTEAAAATAFGKRHIVVDRTVPVRFIVDRPFVLIIRDKELDNILFIGVVRKPSGAL